MKLQCCKCGKEYEVDWLTAKNVDRFIELPAKSAGAIIKCPHCGLRHWLFIVKFAEEWAEAVS